MQHEHKDEYIYEVAWMGDDSMTTHISTYATLGGSMALALALLRPEADNVKCVTIGRRLSLQPLPPAG